LALFLVNDSRAVLMGQFSSARNSSGVSRAIWGTQAPLSVVRLAGNYLTKVKSTHAIRAWKTLVSSGAGGRLIFAFDLSQFRAQLCRFGAIFFCLDMVLDGGDAADRIEHLGESIVLAFAGMF
jgi:hypothetical protein